MAERQSQERNYYENGRHENTFCESTCVCFSHSLVRRNRKTRNVAKHTQRGEGERNWAAKERG